MSVSGTREQPLQEIPAGRIDKRRLLVAGGTGWLGRQVIQAARTAGIEAFGVARGEKEGHHVFLCDAMDGGAVDAIVEEIKPEAIVNCVRTGPEDPGAVQALRALASAARRRNVRLVHVGSAAEYGEAGPVGRIGEGRRPRPLTAYGRAKAEATAEALAARMQGCDAVVGRVFNLVGPGEGEGTVAGAWAARIARAELVEGAVVEVARAVRDFLDVRDAARALLVLAFASLRHPLYNVCSGRGIRTDDLVRRILRTAGVEVRVQAVRRISKGTLGPARSVGSPTRMRSLGWRPLIALDQSCRDLLVEKLRRLT